MPSSQNNASCITNSRLPDMAASDERLVIGIEKPSVMVDHNWSMNVSNLGGAVSELSLQERLDRLRASCANHCAPDI
jgi:hypothetical protein